MKSKNYIWIVAGVLLLVVCISNVSASFAGGWITVTSNPDYASVYIDGNWVGNTGQGGSFTSDYIIVGTHTVEVAENYLSQTHSVTVNEGEYTPLVVDLTGTPTFTTISPSSGPTAGGQSVTIEGSNFYDGWSGGDPLTVTIGGSPATVTAPTDGTFIFATTPAGIVGSKDVVITNGGSFGHGGQVVTGMGAYSYTASAPAPHIDSISPLEGANSNSLYGDYLWITIDGSDFQNNPTVSLKQGATSFDAQSYGGPDDPNHQIYAWFDLNGRATGKWLVVVTNPDGQKSNEFDGFTVVPPPTIASISPDSGTVGTQVPIDILGTGFESDVEVQISSGDGHIVPIDQQVIGTSEIQCTFDLTDAEVGIQELEVTNPTSGGYTYSSFEVTAQADNAPAIQYGKTTYLDGPNHEGNGNQFLEVSDNVIPPNTVITLLDGTTITSPADPSYLIIYDKDKNGNPAKQLIADFYVDDTHHAAQTIWEFPTGIPLSFAGGNLPNYGGLDHVGEPYSPDPACTPDSTHNYAVLISGGGDNTTNYARYYNDIKFLYNTLISTYGYTPNHIKVVMSDGTDPTKDQLTTTGTINSDPKLDGTNSVNILPATNANVKSAISTWSPALTSSDTLLIFTTGHGQIDSTNTNTGDANNNKVDLLLWGAGEKITDAELVAALPSGPKILMVMEQCNGGGFKNDFIPTSGSTTRVLTTAASGNEGSHSNDFSYYWISGVGQHDSATPTPHTMNTDTLPSPNGDGLVSMREAYTYANSLDPSGPNYAKVETPTFNEWTTNPAVGLSTFVTACLNNPSITVTLPTTSPANTWYKGSPYTIKWSTTNLPASPTPTLKVELWKGPVATATKQATISSSVAASAGTAGVIFTPNTLAGGPGTDYWVKISTLSTSPLVVGTSGNINLPNVSTADNGALSVSATDSKTGSALTANIILRDSSNNPVSIGNIVQPDTTTTPKTYSPLVAPTTYNVQVTKSCYYSASATIQVNPGVSTPATYAPALIPVDKCTNGVNVGPSGSIAITSLPEEGFRVYLKGGTLGSSYHDMGYNTPVIQDIGIGDYMVKLVADGYQSQEQPVTVTAGNQANAVFELVPIPSVNAQVMIVPQPLNIGKTGYFLAFVKLPTGSKAADVIDGSVYCGGARALKLIRINLFPQIFVAIFQRQDMWNVLTGDKVTMQVTGSIKKSQGNAKFTGSDTLKVFSQKVTTKEDVDNVLTLTDTQVFTKFNKF